MTFQQLRWRFTHALQFFPFTLNTLVFAAGTWAAFYLLYTPKTKDDDTPALFPLVSLMGKIAICVFLTLLLISVLSTLVCWIRFLVRTKRDRTSLQLQFTTETRKGRTNRLFLNAKLEGAWRPFLGFVNGSIVYDSNLFSDRFVLLSKTGKTATEQAHINGRSRLALPDIKEYDIRGGFVYFHDMLHLFSLAVKQPISGHFYQPPVLLKPDEKDASPRKTETLDIRIDQLRRVEGEYLNYKDFEAGDDVRRIVWKVYAKNRELVVRVPEMFEPYASHLYMYASFYEQVMTKWVGEGYMRELLNYYKNCVWTVYDTLAQKDANVSLIPDQPFSAPETTDEHERVARTISNSNWQRDIQPSQYFNVKTGAVLCVSSLIDVADLRALLERCDPSVVIYFVRVSNRLKHFAPLNWLARLVLLPPKDRLNRLRTTWTFSPLRTQVLKREKEIREVLRGSNVIWGEL
jgi:hypothetical protein